MPVSTSRREAPFAAVMWDVKEEVERAERRIRAHIRETPLEPCEFLSAAGGSQVYCKLENLQRTGSFKVRGALNKVLSLPDPVCARGVVAASTGNHGAAVAYAARLVGTTAIVFVPEGAATSKVRAIERLGAEVRTHGRDSGDTERHARAFAADRGSTYVSPYNDAQVIGGQGTIGVELARQLDQIDAIFVAVGGGGLVSGVAGYLKAVRPGLRVFGCSPENSQVMIQSVRAGGIVDAPSLPTLSDGTAGGVEAGAITFALCRDLVDVYVTVTELEIEDALRAFVRSHRMPIEGAAAVAVASYLKTRAGDEALFDQNVVVVICGANIDLDTLQRILSAGRDRRS